MLTGLLASAREVRNPLTVGYSALLAFWLVAGEEVTSAARDDELGRRIIAGLDSMGDAANFALYTFIAAMVGSLLWNGGVSRLVRFLSERARHPDWDEMIEEARSAVRRYEVYEVTTYKGQGGSTPSGFDKKHTVPSPHHATYLQARVDERERKSAEMSFRVTLAVALLPVAIALGIEGGGLWWWWLSAIPVVWLDVALMKNTTLRVVRRYELEDLKSKLERIEQLLESAKGTDTTQGLSKKEAAQVEANRVAQMTKYQEEINTLQAAIKRLQDDDARLASKLSAWLEGRPTP